MTRKSVFIFDEDMTLFLTIFGAITVYASAGGFGSRVCAPILKALPETRL